MSSIDYNLHKVKAIAFDVDGVLSPSTIPMSDSGEPLRMVNIKDGYAIQLAIKRGLKLCIISGGKTEGIRTRFFALGITDIYLGAAHKLPILEQWMNEKSLLPEETAFVGDDIPDIKALMHVGLPCCPHDAAPEVRAVSRYISYRDGGYGVGRDIIEQILKAKGLWMNDSNAFGW